MELKYFQKNHIELEIKPYEKVERKMVPMMKINRHTLLWELTDIMIDNKGRGKS